jgi:hypothetical protein
MTNCMHRDRPPTEIVFLFGIMYPPQYKKSTIPLSIMMPTGAETWQEVPCVFIGRLRVYTELYLGQCPCGPGVDFHLEVDTATARGPEAHNCICSQRSPLMRFEGKLKPDVPLLSFDSSCLTGASCTLLGANYSPSTNSC